MKFSSLEQQVIKDLCNWARNANVFCSVRNFFSDKALPKGTGLFLFSKEEEDRPQIILCIDQVRHCVEQYSGIYNHVLFILHFLRKLEQSGLITISEGHYSEKQEYAIAIFSDFSVIGIKHTDRKPWGYSGTFVEPGHDSVEVELIEKGLELRRVDNGLCLPYYNMEVFSRFDAFSLVASNIALEQDLFDLVENGFKTTEELILENASQQLTTAKSLLEEAKVQTSKAIESIDQSKVQFAIETKSSTEQFVKAQVIAESQFRISLRESKRQFESANCKSIWALVLAVVSIISTPFVAKYVSTTIDENQFGRIDSVQTVISNRLDEITEKIDEQQPDTTLIKMEKELEAILTTLRDIKNNAKNLVRKSKY